MANRSTFFRHGVITFGATAAVNAATFGFHFVASRLVGVRSYGELYTMMSAVSLAAVLGGVGTTIVARLMAEIAVKNRPDALGAMTARVFWAAAAVCVLSGLLLTVLGYAEASFFRASSIALVRVTAWAVATQFALVTLRGLLQGAQRFGSLAVSLVGEAAVRVLVGAYLIYSGWGATGGLYGYLIGALAAIIYTYIIAAIYFGFRPTVRLGVVSDVRKVAGGVSASMLALGLLSYGDVLLVKHYVEPTSAGLFSAIALIGKIVLFASSFVPLLVLPKAAAAVAVGKSPVPVVIRGAIAATAVSAVILLFFGVFPGFPVLMMGVAFAGTAPYIVGYGAAMALLGVATAVVSYRIGIGNYGFVPVSFLSVILGAIGVATFHAGLSQIISVVAVANALNLFGACVGALKTPLALMNLDDALEASVALESATELH